jgi:epoxyqueuosine reductase
MNSNLRELRKSNLEELNEELFEIVFQKSAVKRTGYKGLKRNIKFIRQE